MSKTLASHGEVGRRENTFTRLLPERLQQFDENLLKDLAEQMIGDADDASNAPDAEENLVVPAGYTYLGQFIDHDLTFETTSSFNNPTLIPTNLRTPRLDLDCVYGTGPDDQPYLYAGENKNGLRRGSSLLLGDPIPRTNRQDLLRIPDNERAVIGDPRNDENSIVCNIQAAFIAIHNAIVAWVDKAKPGQNDRAIFVAARKLLRWSYQRVVTEDYLPRIINPTIYEAFQKRLARQGEGAFQLYTVEKRHALPIEFVGAAYRYGHSMVRTGYKLNADHVPQKIFTPGEGANSLVGFGRLPSDHWAEWKRFFPRDGDQSPTQNIDNSSDRLQWAYRIDTSLVDPLAALPRRVDEEGRSLAKLNLLRGNLFRLVSGQTVAEKLGISPLAADYLCVRAKHEDGFGFKPINSGLQLDTPLWFYVLAEAQAALVDTWNAKRRLQGDDAVLTDEDLRLGIDNGNTVRAPIAQLGPVGGTILAETFYGILLSDSDSYLSITTAEDANLANAWFSALLPAGEPITMWKLLDFANLV